MVLIIRGEANKLSGEITVPGDKSISHRSIIIGSLANGNTTIDNILDSDDVLQTLLALKKMGVNIKRKRDKVFIEGVGQNGLKAPNGFIDCGNSGTTARILCGVLAGQAFSTTLVGDASLSKRPMDRIIIPLRQMGANINGNLDKFLPIKIEPAESNLKPIKYELPVASAQVKSSILFANLYTQGATEIIEKKVTRDHTERMLSYFGCDITNKDGIIHMDSKCKLKGRNIYIPGDISSAAYFIVAATLVKDSNLIIKKVGINPTRTGIINVLKKMGAYIKVYNRRTINNEPVGDINIKYSPLKGISIDGAIIGTLIDEIPIIAVAASLASGKTIIKEAQELKYKESNRIKTISTELMKMGANIKEMDDGMIIEGRESLTPASVETHNDHRIAMAISIAALRAKGESVINDYECVNISYPDFYETLHKLKMKV